MVGGGAAGVYGAIRAKTVAPKLNVLVIEKAKPLSKVFEFLLNNHYSNCGIPLCLSLSRLLFLSFRVLNFGYWQVKISGGGRCNVTNGHCADNMVRSSIS